MNQTIEMIDIRSQKRDAAQISTIKKMLKQIQKDTAQLQDIKLLRNQFISTDLCIILILNKSKNFSKSSSLASIIINYLEPGNLVNHSIWKKEY